MISGCKETETNGTSLQAADEACAANPTLRNGGSNSKSKISFIQVSSELIICFSLSLPDVEHRKSFAEMTEAQVHPASSASAPEGFLNPQDNPNGNENSTTSTRFLHILMPRFGINFLLPTLAGESGMRRTSSVPDQRSLLDKRPDPVREVWPDMLVKIADLGNACWVVSKEKLEPVGRLLKLFFLFLSNSITTLRRIFKRGNTVALKFYWVLDTGLRPIFGARPAWRSSWRPVTTCSSRTLAKIIRGTRTIWPT